MNPGALPGSNPLKIQVPIRKARRVSTRGDGYKAIQGLARGFANDTSQNPLLPQWPLSSAQKPGVLTQAANILSRVPDAPNPTAAQIKEQKKKNEDAFGSLYRKTWDKQDELFSTASARSFIAGLLEKAPPDQIDPRVWQRWVEMVDLISSLRIPTKFSGFSTSAAIMQHPTAAGEGYFAAAATASTHGTRDSERVKYIGRALESSENAGQDLGQQLFAGMRAAIEFSLNYFTAPVTASNVKPFSTKAAVLSDDPSLQEQLEARERIKEIYLKIGGTLRNPSATETPEQSWDRPWQQGLAIAKQDPFPVAPPSPRRTRRNANPVQTSTVATPAPVGSVVPQAVPLATPVSTATSPFAISASHVAGPLSSPSPMMRLPTPSMFPAYATPYNPFASFYAPAFYLPPITMLATDALGSMQQGFTQAAWMPDPQGISTGPLSQPPAYWVDSNVADDPMDLSVAESVQAAGTLPNAAQDDLLESTDFWLNPEFFELLPDSFWAEFATHLSNLSALDGTEPVSVPSASAMESTPVTADMFPVPPQGLPGLSEQTAIYRDASGDLDLSSLPSVQGLPSLSDTVSENVSVDGGLAPEATTEGSADLIALLFA